MDNELILGCPREQIAATYLEYPDTRHYKKLTINALTGCMGLICVVNEGLKPALLVHDASDGYPHAKKKLQAFIQEHAAFIHKMEIVWSAGHSWGQSTWMEIHLPGASVDKLHTGIGSRTDIHWPLDHGGKTIPVTAENEIPRVSEKLRILKNTDKDWRPDSEFKACPICEGKLSMLSRHHCRNCGRLVCSSCCAKRSPLKSAYMDRLGRDLQYYCVECLPPVGASGGKNW